MTTRWQITAINDPTPQMHIGTKKNYIFLQFF